MMMQTALLGPFSFFFYFSPRESVVVHLLLYSLGKDTESKK